MRSPFELKSLIEWLEKQPADQEYRWCDSTECLFGRYAASFGLAFRDLINSTAAHHFFRAGIGIKTPHTFGAALERARSLLRTGE